MARTDRRPVSRSYLLTFTCYGARLHGDEPGSVDREHCVPGTPYADPDALRLADVQRRMTGDPYRLDAVRRKVVLSAVCACCERRGWDLLAAHVRSNHVHGAS